MKYIFLLLSLFLFSACDEQSKTIIDYPSEAYKILDEKKKLWEASNIEDYSFVVNKSCSCPYEENKQITVSNGAITESKYIPSDTALDTQQKMIAEYFDIIQDALDRNAHKLTVTYDKIYGYPSDISIDYDQELADEEIYYTLTHFHKDDDNIFCTEEYMPICGEVNILCVTTPCETIEETFSNKCFLNANPNAIYLRDGEC